MVDTDIYPGTTGDRPALAHRLAALAAEHSLPDDPDLPVGPVLAASLTGLRAEVIAMRTDIDGLRVHVTGRPTGAGGSPGEALEERLAAIEDTLESLHERFEAMAHHSAIDSGERIASVDDRIAALSQSLQAERVAAAQHREHSGVAMQDQAAALDEWAEAVRGGLEDLGEAVTASLGSLSASVTGSATTGRDAERRHVEALIAELSQTIEDSVGVVHDQVEAYNAPMAGKLEDLHASVLDGFGGARARLIEELSGTIARLEQANSATRATVEAELSELRGDLADALDEVRERVEGTVAGHKDSIETIVSGAHQSIAASLEEHQQANAGLREGIVAAALTSKDSGARVQDMQEVVTRLDSTLSDLQSDWRPQVDAVVAQGHAAAKSVLEQVQAEHQQTLTDMRGAMASHAAAMEGVSGSLGGSTERMISAGQALLAYLGERDRWLERERDRVLHEVLDEFAQGLSAKERRAVSSRMAEALDRRRDARDAERFRRTEDGKPAIEIPEVPPEIAELGQPVVPVLPPPPPAKKTASLRRAPAKPTAKPAAPVKAAAPAKKATSAAAKTAAAAKKALPAKASPAKKATASTAKKVATTATKTAAKTAAKTTAKKAAPAKKTTSSTTRSS